ncbi:hypothetical protein B9Z55_026435 [Caenorhabditis nigoni]|uniref:Uncharacterized protein n=1 Tax=Caenorhabditis nigoni TaxID=1611254 RepID=A0A2G5T333_9PELO|nr:hypothetical protein B9Z55_026435 [Caenorhabditis nigoni]
MLAKINCCRRAGKVTPEDPRRDSIELANVPEAAQQEAQAAPQEDQEAASQVHQEAVVEQRVVTTNVIMVQPKPEKVSKFKNSWAMAHASIGRQSSKTMMGLKEALNEIKKPGVTVLEGPAIEEVVEKVTEPRTLVSRKKKLDSLKKQDSVDPEDD